MGKTKYEIHAVFAGVNDHLEAKMKMGR